MQIHTLTPRHTNKAKKRIGRGGKRGSYSGHGQKGQQSRAGRKLRPAERDIISKFPKFRGTGNTARRKEKVFEIYLNQLHLFSDEKGIISKKGLLKKKFISNLSSPVKIILRGEPKTSFHIQDIPASVAAKKKIEEKGGSFS